MIAVILGTIFCLFSVGSMAITITNAVVKTAKERNDSTSHEHWATNGYLVGISALGVFLTTLFFVIGVVDRHSKRLEEEREKKATYEVVHETFYRKKP
jgi:hypothetical protein